ncbi:MAG: glycosyltransferase family 2 protein [Candidatus Promineifilaceae bacterium]|nr:glycosyltransferase family 2 protein [Candidatus Promineifilaceae bacterium]
MLDVAVVIVSWNVRDYLAECLSTVYAELRYSRLNGEIWVVDNGSTDGTLALLGSLFPHTRLRANDTNIGFGAANNQGMADAAAESPRYFLLLNPDTLIRPGGISQMVDCLDRCPEAGMVGARLVYRDGRFQHSAFTFPGITQLLFDLWPMPSALYDSRLNGRYARRLYRPDGDPFAVDFPLGAAMLVRRDVAEATGGFDESFHMYCEEIDWAWRIRNAGWGIYTVPGAEIVHYGGESTKQVPARSIVNLWQSRARLYRKHHTPARFALARRLATRGLARKAAAAPNRELREAYRRAAGFWQTVVAAEEGEEGVSQANPRANGQPPADVLIDAVSQTVAAVGAADAPAANAPATDEAAPNDPTAKKAAVSPAAEPAASPAGKAGAD